MLRNEEPATVAEVNFTFSNVREHAVLPSVEYSTTREGAGVTLLKYRIH